MNRKSHVMITELVFGKGYDDVHIWLDELFPKYRGFEHWKERHHLRAIEEKYSYGTEKYWVAVLHVLMDWFSHLRMYNLPADEDEVILWLNDCGVI